MINLTTEKEWPWPLGLGLILGIWLFVNRRQPNCSRKKWSIYKYNVFCCMFMAHWHWHWHWPDLELLLVRIEYNISLYLTFCIYLNQFYGTVFTFLWSPVSISEERRYEVLRQQWHFRLGVSSGWLFTSVPPGTTFDQQQRQLFQKQTAAAIATFLFRLSIGF